MVHSRSPRPQQATALSIDHNNRLLPRSPVVSAQVLWSVVSCRKPEVLKTGEPSVAPWEPAFGRLDCIPALSTPNAIPTLAALDS